MTTNQSQNEVQELNEVQTKIAYLSDKYSSYKANYHGEIFNDSRNNIYAYFVWLPLKHPYRHHDFPEIQKDFSIDSDNKFVTKSTYMLGCATCRSSQEVEPYKYYELFQSALKKIELEFNTLDTCAKP
jgi:hypothetical protein